MRDGVALLPRDFLSSLLTSPIPFRLPAPFLLITIRSTVRLVPLKLLWGLNGKGRKNRGSVYQKWRMLAPEPVSGLNRGM